MRTVMYLTAVAVAVCGIQTMARAETPTFRAYEIATPGGKRIGVVDMTVGGRRSRVVEVVSAMPGWPVGKRAETVADRLRQVHEADATWWKRLAVGKANKSVVVTVSGVKVPNVPKSSSGAVYLITADPKFAREWGMSPDGLARQLVSGITRTFQPTKVSWGKRGTDGKVVPPPPPTAEEKRANAIRAKQDGDDAYGREDYESAEANYLDAIKMSPQYAVPYLRLAELYCSQGKTGEARSILEQAKGIKGLSADDKSEINRLMSQVR